MDFSLTRALGSSQWPGVRAALAGNPDSTLFSPAGTVGPMRSPSVLSTYQGPGRDRVLGFLERIGRVPAGVADAARQGALPQDLGRAVQAMTAQQAAAAVADTAARTLGMSAGVPADASAALRVVGFGDPAAQTGMLARQLVAEHAAAAGIPLSAVQIVPSMSAPVEAAAVAAAAPAVASASTDGQKVVSEALEYLAKADPQTRMSVLAEAVSIRAAAGQGEPIEMLLTRSLAEAPVEQSGSALAQAIDDVMAARPLATGADDAARAAVAVADVVPTLAKAAPVAVDGATAVLPRIAGRMMRLEPAIVEALRLLRL